MEIVTDTHLKSFLKQPTLFRAKQMFVAYRENGLPVPEDIVDFLTEEFRKDISNGANRSQTKHPAADRLVLVELLMRIAESEDGERIDTICQMVAEKNGIRGNETNTAGELLRQMMEEYPGK